MQARDTVAWLVLGVPAIAFVLIMSFVGFTEIQEPDPSSTPSATLTVTPSRTPYPTYTSLPTFTPFPTQTKLPTYTPLPTFTPFPEPSVLDWHIAFSTSVERNLFECNAIISDIALQTPIMTPRTVEAQVTIVTQQILQETIDILESTRSGNVVDLEEVSPELLIALVQLEFAGDADITAPIPLSPDFYGSDDIYLLQDMIFRFAPNPVGNQLLLRNEQTGEVIPTSTLALPRLMNPSNIYPIIFQLEDTTLEELQTGDPVSIEFTLVMGGPFTGRNCEVGNTVRFSLPLNMASGDAREVTLRFGDIDNDVNVNLVRSYLIREIVGLLRAEK